MRIAVVLVILLALGAFLLHFGLTGRLMPGASPEPPPNVLLIVIDALRADRIEAARNGVPVMPNLARLAGESAYFPHAVAPASWTRPSMASLMTALPVDQHQVYYLFNNPGETELRSDNLAPAYETLAEYLSAHGYDTFGIVTNGNLQPGTGFEQGFNTYEFIDYAEHAPADTVTGRALQTLPNLTPPFFAYLHYMDPHAPYQAPPPHDTAFGPLPEPATTDAPVFADNASFMAYLVESAKHAANIDIPRTFPPLSPQGRERVRARYDGECHFADAEVARVIAAVQQQHPNTLVVVTADHGEEFWEHGGMGHGTTLYEEQIRVPLLINGPGIPPTRTGSPASTIGLAETIRRYLHPHRVMDPRPTWHGQDLLGVVDDTAPAYARTLSSTPDWGIDLEAILEGSLKGIHDRGAQTLALYDLTADPAESHDLSGTMTEVSRAVRDQLEHHRARALSRAFRNDTAEEATTALPSEVIERMEALGYVDAGPIPREDEEEKDPQ